MDTEWAICFLFYGLIFGALCSVIFGRRGHDAGWGFVAGFLLGVFGLVIGVCLTRNEDALRARSVHAGTHRVCPHCSEMIRVEAKVCPQCRRDIPSYAVTPPVERQELKPGSPVLQVTRRIVTCPRCKEEWTVAVSQTGAVTCSACTHEFAI